MKAVRAGVPVIAFCALLSACGNPSGPSKASYEGQWTGTTAQGKTVTFTISPDENVTGITVGHEFNGCSGTQTFSNLSVSIAPQVQCIPAPCSNQLMSYRAFSYQSGDPVEGPATSLNALFTSAGRVEGMVNFRLFPGCGSAMGVVWSATKR
jgi:hypothetical protein